MMILGIPNVGKSTLMNAILKRHVAHVGDEPAITKIQMFHRLGPGMTLVDTPGMLWPGMEQATAFRLAALHSIGRGAYDDEEVALTLGLYLLRHYPELLAKRYGVLPRPCNEHMLLALIAAGRSLAKKPGGGPDLARASVALLNDFRTGTLGRITLETVDEGGAGVTAEPRRDLVGLLLDDLQERDVRRADDAAFFIVSLSAGALAKSLACARLLTLPTTTTCVGSPASVKTVAEVHPSFLRAGSLPS